MTHIHRLLIRTAQFGARHVDAHGLVSAADVEADTRRADRVPVGHDTSDRDSVTEVVARHERNFVGSAGADTNLAECTVIGLSEDRDAVVENLHGALPSAPVLHCPPPVSIPACLLRYPLLSSFKGRV